MPKITGAPGRTSWVRAAPASTSASTWASVPATVTGLMAPARMKGVTMHGLVGARIDLERAEHGAVPDHAASWR